MTRVIITGSRTFTDYQYLERKLDQLFYGWDHERITILLGACRGVDILGERYATENSLSLESFSADCDRYGKGAVFKRNIEMAKSATHCVVFQVANSKGSQYMIDQAYRENLEVIVFTPDSDDTNTLPVMSVRQGLTQQTTNKQRIENCMFSRNKAGYDLPCFAKDADAPAYHWRKRMDQVDQIRVITFTKAKFISVPQGVVCLFEITEPIRGEKIKVDECPYLTVLLHSKEYKAKNWDTGDQDTVQPTEAEILWLATLKKEGFLDSEDLISDGKWWYLDNVDIWKDNLSFALNVSYFEGNDKVYDDFNALAKLIKDGCGNGGNGKTYTPKQSASDRLKEVKPLVDDEINSLAIDDERLAVLKHLNISLFEYLSLIFK